VTEAEILDFVRKSIRSLSALEVLRCLRGDRDRSWRADALVRELRSSKVAIADALNCLRAAGLVEEAPNNSYRYHPASPELDEVAAIIVGTYAAMPSAVINALFAEPNEKLRLFSDAFKLKE
jgi:hypothetical protein